MIEEDEFTWLDEPPHKPPRRRELRREWVVGLFLLLGILGWTVWDAQRTQRQQANYQAGARAVAANDWDGARTAFLAAEDYRDARAQAAAAATQIARRDLLYAAGVSAVARAEWLPAVRDLRAVEAIQPGFGDSARLRATAEQQVYTTALDGSIIQRPAADPPGLYIYRAGRWVWLKDSDAASFVRGGGSGCAAIYDVPASPARIQPPGFDPSTDGSGGIPLRRLMLARPQGPTLLFQPLAFDPLDFSQFTCGEQGVVAMRYENGPGVSNDPRLQPYDGGTVLTFRLPAGDWTLLERDRTGEVLVLSNTIHNSAGQIQTYVYLANVGGTPRLVAERDAVVQQAFLSPDRRFLVLDELGGLSSGGRYEHQLTLLHVDGSQPPFVLRQSTDDPTPAPGWYWAWFLSAGANAGQALIGGPPLWDNEIDLLDPAHPDPIRPVARSGNNEKFTLLYPLASGLLLGWRATTPDGAMRYAYFDRAGPIQPLDLQLRPSEGPWAVTQYGDSLIYVSSTGVEIDGQTIHTRILSIPLSGTGAPTSLYEYTLPQADNSPVSWVLSPSALVVVHNGELHALSYDGQVDLLLERGVRWIDHPATP